MNKRRRKELGDVLGLLDRLNGSESVNDALELINKAIELTEECMDEEEDSLNNLPESLSSSSMADDMSDNVSDLQDAIWEIEVIGENITNMNAYDYQLVAQDIDKAYNMIKNVINR